tara:strand:+ start:158 stop:343 length:186 start_codon:yes stop_codon:yes gene_type:complete
MSKITITFTEQQALCLMTAASQVMDHGDVVEMNFSKRGEKIAAYNAYNKLRGEYFKQRGEQ